ncbi:hypothetical protein VZ95_20890 [Elstera litoralis]|uniref:Uncharacterized protein n=2 Tax=Elstera litoralis TaxID=552518 RepID=A0A0F3IKS4_9PROT|nr:hypothetical protein [Elstera litoralis]KJV06159.1 hypothetical protein VZ95_20890 [Elstera litoralis]
METVRTIDGEIEDIRDRISSTGDSVCELHLITSGGKEKCFAYADKATIVQNLLKKMQELATRNGVAHIKELHVRVEVTGIVKNQSSSKDLIVTAVKIQQ